MITGDSSYELGCGRIPGAGTPSPGSKAIWKVGVGWVAEGAVGKGPGKDRRARLQMGRATQSSRALRNLVHSNTVIGSPALLKP